MLGFVAAGAQWNHLRGNRLESIGASRQPIGLSRRPIGVSQRQPLRMVASQGSSTPERPTEPSSLALALHKFSRPHTIRGTILGALAGCSRGLIENRQFIDWNLIPTALMGVLALLLGNVFIVGINQIYDVNVDKVNKPFLPLASGEMSKTLAWTVVIGCLVGGMFLTYRFYSALTFKMYAFGLLLGTLYSVPPFSLRRFPVAAALIISTVRGFLLNFGVYQATVAALKAPFYWNVPIVFLASFMTLFAIVIALSKDIPDIKGDQSNEIQTFATRFGPANMVKLVTNLLSLDYVMAITVAVRYQQYVRAPVMIAAHAVMLVALQLRSRKVDADSSESIKKFYAFIWMLFYSEYMLFPFL